MKLFDWIKRHWGQVLLGIILLFIVGVNFMPGFFVLGNDNFSPELDPQLTLERSVFSSAWRAYRVFGLPSDSEQADIFRTGVFWVFEKFLPAWFVSQGYLFFTFLIASVSMAFLCQRLLRRLFDGRYDQFTFLLGGLFYLSNMLTSWVYFFPVHLFVAAYAFLPFVLWRLGCFFENQNTRNTLLLLVSSLFLSTAALTATMFFTCALIILLFSIIFYAEGKKKSREGLLKIWFSGLFIVIGVQAYWVVSFIDYISTNTKDLQNSSINRDITPVTVENEAKHNTALDTFRYYFSWMDTRENSITYTFAYRDWYKKSLFANALSFLPIIFMGFGISYLLRKRDKVFLSIPLVLLLGWFMIKGVNAPFGFVFTYFQDNFPILAQAFRWQSSKMWPLLAITIPILATIGVIWVVGGIKMIVGKIGSFFFLLFVTVSLLVFVFPYFKGDLVREKVFVRVPQEYFDLASYLKENDRFSRIYLAPEANTLYFRNYSWGFWGSVVLNYILPNPIIEKALVIGSSDNEQGYKVLTNAYYSEDPSVFATALSLYNTNFVLLDKNASRGDVGYSYDLNVYKKVIEENPYLKKAWEGQDIILYRLDLPRSSEARQVSSVNNYERLNRILSLLRDNTSYYSNGKGGYIFPFAMNFDRLKFEKNKIVVETDYEFSDQKYQLVVGSNLFKDSPAQVLYNSKTKEVTFFPLYPYISLNNKAYTYELPFKKFRSVKDVSFVAFQGDVVDERDKDLTSKAISATYDKVFKTSYVKAWDNNFKIVDFLDSKGASFTCNGAPIFKDIKLGRGENVKCASENIDLGSDSVVEFEIQMKASRPTNVVFCANSSFRQNCMNLNRYAYVDGQTRKAVVFIPKVFEKSDSLKVFLDFGGESDGEFSIEELKVKIYGNNSVLEFMQEYEGGKEIFDLDIKRGDVISLNIPLLKGTNSWQLFGDELFISEMSVFQESNDLKERKNSIGFKYGVLNFYDKERSTSVFPRLELLDPRDGVGMVAFRGNNVNGIPLDISVRDVNREHKIWKEKILYRQTSNTLDLFMLPNEVRSYFLEFLSSGIGDRPSENKLNSFVFQIIPRSWYSLTLIPMEEERKKIIELKQATNIETNNYRGAVPEVDNTIYVIDNAISSRWKMDVGGKNANGTLVNGWQQGFVIDKKGEGKVYYETNFWVYLGFIPLVVSIGWIVVKGFKTLSQRGG